MKQTSTLINTFFAVTLFAINVAAVNCTTGDLDRSEPARAQIQEATSLLGGALYIPDLAPDQKLKLEADLAGARSRFENDPENVNNIIWLGRRTAYLWRYQDAISIYTDGIERFPDEPRLYRHRGHRYISIRAFDKALADLTYAAELIRGTEDETEPDGVPNPAGIPTSTLHTNIFYHLGLAYYLKGDFEQALNAYSRCLELSKNDDMYVATADWLYMTLRRLGRLEEAEKVLEPIHAGMQLLENEAYHSRLLMYKGELEPESLLYAADENITDLNFATQGYGVGNWYLYNGRVEEANTVFRRVLESGYWSAFGYIAAEADIKRLQ